MDKARKHAAKQAKRAVKQAKLNAPATKHELKARNAAKRANAGEKQAYKVTRNAARRVAKRHSVSGVISKEVQYAAEAVAEAHAVVLRVCHSFPHLHCGLLEVHGK